MRSPVPGNVSHPDLTCGHQDPAPSDLSPENRALADEVINRKGETRAQVRCYIEECVTELSTKTCDVLLTHGLGTRSGEPTSTRSSTDSTPLSQQFEVVPLADQLFMMLLWGKLVGM